MTMNELQALADFFGYATQLSGDRMVAHVYMNGTFLYTVDLL